MSVSGAVSNKSLGHSSEQTGRIRRQNNKCNSVAGGRDMGTAGHPVHRVHSLGALAGSHSHRVGSDSDDSAHDFGNSGNEGFRGSAYPAKACGA